jgi:hypothetical protein
VISTRAEPRADQQKDPGAQAPGPACADQVDQAILGLLLFEPGLALWAIDEIVREIGSRIAVTDSLCRLHRAGVIHRLDGFVFASRTAARTADVLDPDSARVSWTRG